MADSKRKTLTTKEVYDEIGRNYRYFLNWRHALFAGYLLILYTLAQGYFWLFEHSQQNIWVIFLAGLLISLCIWVLEIRVRDLYQACTKAGRNIENEVGGAGIYTELNSDSLRNKALSHSNALNCFLVCYPLAFSLCLSTQHVNSSNNIYGKRANLQADTSPLEKEIDQLVYQLYGLTEDEVKIAEGRL